jgi:ADP-ribose pyrophosphatase YjhB (NUDIX family)
VPARDVTTRYFASDPTELRLSVCVVARRSESSREILLMRRSDNAHWGLPGGYVERGESVRAAAQREVREETGYEVDLGRLVGVYSDPASMVIDYGDGRRVHAVNLCFEAVTGALGEATTPQETLEIGFFDAAALPRPFVPIHEIRVRDAESGGDVAVR